MLVLGFGFGQVAGWILELDRGQGIPFEGNYSAWLDNKVYIHLLHSCISFHHAEFLLSFVHSFSLQIPMTLSVPGQCGLRLDFTRLLLISMLKGCGVILVGCWKGQTNGCGGQATNGIATDHSP